MSNSERDKQEKLEKKKARREEKKKKLIAMSDVRAKRVGAPNFGFKEGDFIKMSQTVMELVKSNNQMVGQVKELMSVNVIEKTLEAHYMMQAFMKIIIDKGLITQEELFALARDIQTRSEGLVDKPEQTVAVGDTILMKFKIYDGETIVDDQTNSVLAYDVGTKALPCDEGMIGMKRGEVRIFDVVFGEGFRFKNLINKTLQMEVRCEGVKVKMQVPASIIPTQAIPPPVQPNVEGQSHEEAVL